MGGHVIRFLAAYVEGELVRDDRERVARHLEQCRRCTEQHDVVRRSVRDVGASLGAVSPPDLVAARIRRQLRSAPLSGSLPVAASGTDIRRATAAVAAAVFAFVLAAVWWLEPVAGPVRLLAAEQAPLPFESLARQTHLELGRGPAGLQLASSSTDEVRRWVEDRTAVRLNLVSERLPVDAGRYRVLGATRLTGPGGFAVAAVRYEIDGRPTTLLAAHQGHVPGAPRWSTGRKRVLYRAGAGISQLTWTNSGNAYSLVTELPDAGREACGICHREAPAVTGPVPDM